MGIRAKGISRRLPDEVIQQRISEEIDLILQHLPDYPDQVIEMEFIKFLFLFDNELNFN